jgi:hypothetical protein
MKLTAAIVRSLRDPGKYCDGHGLFLHVIDGGLGSLPGPF